MNLRQPLSLLLLAVAANTASCQNTPALFTSSEQAYPFPESSQTIESADRTLALVDGVQLDSIEWKEQGSLSFLLRMKGIEDSRLFELEKGEYTGVKFLKGPAFDLHLYFTHKGLGGIGVIIDTESGEEKRYNAPITHLRGNQTYHITLTWDLPERKFGVYYNGISQGDIAHWAKDAPTLVLEADLPTTLASTFNKHPDIKVFVGDFQLSDQPLSPEVVRALPILENVAPLAGEGRMVYDSPLDLSPYKITGIYNVDFSQPQKIITEQSLLNEDGQRMRLPDVSDKWILEGPDGMQLETRENGLFMETPLPEDRKNGHWVLWANQTFPENILVEYSFTPRTDRQGLNILFFAAHNPNGESIFDLDLPYRGGNFRPYIVGEINSYHISPWATDGESLRATSNMRKNSGFYLVARGNDIIGGSGPGPHTVRILKVGNKVRMESNGIMCLAFDDDGQTYGPVYGEGNIGLRFMAHTGFATLHSLKVYEVKE